MISHSNLSMVAVKSYVVNFGVGIYFILRPRTELANGGMILPGVRSWKARLEGWEK
jgi:hypothetical protein